MQSQTAPKRIFPAEWHPHFGCFLAFPSNAALWGKEALLHVQEEFLSLANAIYQSQERVFMLSLQDDPRLSKISSMILPIAYGDIWLRDTGCICVFQEQADQSLKLKPLCFGFNGWGEKFQLEHDAQVSQALGAVLTSHFEPNPLILEGGSIETNGAGIGMTTKECLLNPNRNKFSQSEIETQLKQNFGFEKILWISQGLLNDHTDGHIDTIARFINPQTIAIMDPVDSDPNEERLRAIRKECEQFTNLQGQPFQILSCPSPGALYSFYEPQKLLPASYLNFYISTDRVIVPLYATPYDQKALDCIKTWFPDKQTIGLPARNIIEGGGAFHCITQQIPLNPQAYL